MSLKADPAAVVVLPPGVSYKGIVIRVVDENDVDKKAERIVVEQGRADKQITEVRLSPTSSIEALIVETE